MTAVPVPFGNDIGASTSSSAAGPTVCALSDGGFVAIWISIFQDGDSWGVYGQRFDASGAAVGSEFRANTFVSGPQVDATAAALPDGGFVVAWTSERGQDGSDSGVYAQRYDSNGAVGGEFRVNTITTNSQSSPVVTALSDGGFVVMFKSSGAVPGDGGDIIGQRYTSSGVAVGGEFRVNPVGFALDDIPAVTALSDGGLLVTWSTFNRDGGGWGIYGQRFDSSGAKAGAHFGVNSYVAGNQDESSSAGLTGGGFVVTWSSQDQDGSGLGIYGQRYDASGAAVGGEFRVNSHTAGDQKCPSTTALPDGGFVVTWSSFGQDGSDWGIYGKRFSSDGTAVGDDFLVNQTTAGAQIAMPLHGAESLDRLNGGQLVQAWTTGINGSVFVRLIDVPDDAPPTLTATATNPSFTEAVGVGTQAAAVSLFSGTSSFTDEAAGLTITELTFTVSGLADGANERIVVDGTAIALAGDPSGTTQSTAMDYAVTVVGGTATVVLSKAGGLSPAAIDALVDGIAYQNVNTDEPTAGSRTVTLIEIKDSGGTANGISDTRTLSITSTVTVVGVNDPPALTAVATEPSFTEAAGTGTQAAAVALFSGTSTGTFEAGQTVTGLSFTVDGLVDGANEQVVVDGTTIALGADASGTTSTNGMTYAVTIVGSTATVVLGKAGGLSPAVIGALVDGIAYQNANLDDPTPGSRTITLTEIRDSGGTAGGGIDATALSIASTVTVHGVNDAPTSSPVTLTAMAEDSGQRVITTAELLANASDLDGDVDLLTVSDLQIASGGGILADLGGGSWGYTPAVNDDTQVSFSFTVSDGTDSSAATATLDITPVNDAPTTSPVTSLFAYVQSNGDFLITEAGLLVNAGDVDGDILRASDLQVASGRGTLTDLGGGFWTYTPAIDDDVRVSFDYTISDGEADVAGAASLRVIDDTADEDGNLALSISRTSIGAGESKVVTFSVTGLDADIDVASASVTFTDSLGNTTTVLAISGAVGLGLFANGNVTSRLTVKDHKGNTATADGAVIFLDANGSNGNDTIVGTPNDDTYNGLGGDDYILGMDGTDHLNGGAGTDILDGGPGADVMTGGDGDDVYFVDDLGDQMIEAPGAGMTAVVASIDWTAPAGMKIDYLSVDSSLTGGLSLTANDLGSSLMGGGGDDRLTGGAGRDQIGGLIGNDVLDGRAGADVMGGGIGNDTYFVDDAGDQVIEAVGEGSDKVYAKVDYTLAAGQEVEWLRAYAGTTGLTLTGNELRNTIEGGAGDDRLYGGGGGDKLNGNGGDDRLDGGSRADIMAGGTGNDTYFVDDVGDQMIEAVGEGGDKVYAKVDYTLATGQEVEWLRAYAGTTGLMLTGNELRNTIEGGAGDDRLGGGGGGDKLNGNGGDDRLDGGSRADIMAGGTGNDTYFVDDAGDQVIEVVAEGSDKVYAKVDYTLAAGQEVEWLRVNAGTTGLTLMGNELRNTIEGGAGDDRLYGGRGGDKLRGGDGADVLDGGTSNDRLEGQGGADIFLFGTRFVGVANVDTIVDFQVGIDTIVLDRTYFASLALGQLSASSFAIGSATGTNPQIVYDQFTGALFYDSNGATAGGASQFATLTGSPALTNADFKIVS